MQEILQLSDTDIRIGEDRIKMDQPRVVVIEPLKILNFSDELLRRMADLEIAHEVLVQDSIRLAARIGDLERRTLWDYVREAWQQFKLRFKR